MLLLAIFFHSPADLLLAGVVGVEVLRGVSSASLRSLSGVALETEIMKMFDLLQDNYSHLYFVS